MSITTTTSTWFSAPFQTSSLLMVLRIIYSGHIRTTSHLFAFLASSLLMELLLPGLCCTGRLWQAQVAALQAAGTDRGASHGIFVGDPHRGDSLAATAAELLEQLPPATRGRAAYGGE